MFGRVLVTEGPKARLGLYQASGTATVVYGKRCGLDHGSGVDSSKRLRPFAASGEHAVRRVLGVLAAGAPLERHTEAPRAVRQGKAAGADAMTVKRPQSSYFLREAGQSQTRILQAMQCVVESVRAWRLPPLRLDGLRQTPLWYSGTFQELEFASSTGRRSPADCGASRKSWRR